MQNTDEQSINSRIVKILEEGTRTFDRHMGMQLTASGPGNVTYRMIVPDNFITMSGAAHGGAVAALMDATLGMTATSCSLANNRMCSTVEFKINYLSPVNPGDILIASANVDHKGKSLMVVNGTIKTETDNRIVAKGLGTFSQRALSPSPGEDVNTTQTDQVSPE